MTAVVRAPRRWWGRWQHAAGLVALADLLPDPAAEWAYRRALCREAHQVGVDAGWEAGRRALLGELAAAQRVACGPAVAALESPEFAELEERRWGPGGRAAFGRPRPGDFPGRGRTGQVPSGLGWPAPTSTRKDHPR